MQKDWIWEPISTWYCCMISLLASLYRAVFKKQWTNAR